MLLSPPFPALPFVVFEMTRECKQLAGCFPRVRHLSCSPHQQLDPLLYFWRSHTFSYSDHTLILSESHAWLWHRRFQKSESQRLSSGTWGDAGTNSQSLQLHACKTRALLLSSRCAPLANFFVLFVCLLFFKQVIAGDKLFGENEMKWFWVQDWTSSTVQWSCSSGSWAVIGITSLHPLSFQ